MESSDLRDQLQRTLGDAYVIERELGGGGMSRVFVARERALNRAVVIKMLPGELSGQLSLERFKREIAVAARLQHAHIVPLLMAGESAGVPYFTMPFVEGESLRARLSREGALPVAEAVRILREVASALAYAHEHGVVHRDIKPENVLLSGGAAMVTDFGVAKAVDDSGAGGGSGLTSIGVALGTPAYMSPEQASADPMVDYRADVYAWGVVAYELLAGTTPFGGRPAQAQLAAHVAETAEDVTKRRPAVPAALASLVMRSLAKRPADRPQGAAELIRQLDMVTTPGQGASTPAHAPAVRAPSRPWLRWAAGTAIVAVIAISILVAQRFARTRGRDGGSANGEGVAVRTMAILAAPTAEDSSQWFADGIAQALEGKLLQVPGLEVHSSASLSATKARELPAEEIGRKLHVASLLRVSVSRNGGRMRASVQLLRTSDGRMEWASDPIVAPVNDIFAVQDTITLRTVAALRIQLAAPGAARLVARGTSVVEANEEFMRGDLLRQRFDLLGSVPHLRKAVALDPGFGLAHAKLALAYIALPMTGMAARDSSLRLSQQSADRALALDSTLASAHLARALVQYADYHFVDAEREVRRAAVLNPMDAEGHAWLSITLAQLGRLDESLEEARAAARIDPLRADALVMVQVLLYAMHRFDDALAATRPVLDVDPTSTMATSNLAEIYAFTGRPDSAVAAARRVLANSPDQLGSRAYALFAFASAGQWAAADSQRAIILHSSTNSPNYNKTLVALVDGDAEAAARAMEAGIAAREPVFGTLLLGCELYFDLLRTNARYIALMKRLGVTPCPPLPRWPIPPRPRR